MRLAPGPPGRPPPPAPSPRGAYLTPERGAPSRLVSGSSGSRRRGSGGERGRGRVRGGAAHFIPAPPPSRAAPRPRRRREALRRRGWRVGSGAGSEGGARRVRGARGAGGEVGAEDAGSEGWTGAGVKGGGEKGRGAVCVGETGGAEDEESGWRGTEGDGGRRRGTLLDSGRGRGGGADTSPGTGPREASTGCAPPRTVTRPGGGEPRPAPGVARGAAGSPLSVSPLLRPRLTRLVWGHAAPGTLGVRTCVRGVVGSLRPESVPVRCEGAWLGKGRGPGPRGLRGCLRGCGRGRQVLFLWRTRRWAWCWAPRGHSDVGT